MRITCEACGRKEDPLRCALACDRTDNWVVECSECDVGQRYSIELKSFMEDPVDWMAQLAEKNWFIGEGGQPGNAVAFAQCFSRMRHQGFFGRASKRYR